MTLVINQTADIRVNYARETITFEKTVIAAEVRFDIEGNVMPMLEEVFSSADITSIVLKADDDSLLVDYSEYAIDHLEQYIQDDIVLTSIILRNDKFITADDEENE
jgi:hypothetical protein